MATPRIFISSTCYDLQEVRLQLRAFVEAMGFEPVMSEFGDIFYDLNSHVQDACRNEVARCNMFVLVIGNNYGSLYHRPKASAEVPDSVTLQEFRKALEVKLPKFIFINRFVKHDFDNYRRALDRQYVTHFQKNNVASEDVERTKSVIKSRFDSTYPFPQDAYRYIFYFLEIISGQQINNAYFPFDSFESIRDMLRKQWAGLVFESLTKGQHIPAESLDVIVSRLDSIERHLKSFVESRQQSDTQSGLVSFDLEKLAAEIHVDELERMQERIRDILREIVFESYGEGANFFINARFQPADAAEWLESLPSILGDYKWSKTIPAEQLLRSKSSFLYTEGGTVPYRPVLELSAVFQKLDAEDRHALARTVAEQLNQVYSPPRKSAPILPPDDEIPF